ncbi:MAG TPA: FAD-dependent oxidoreductase [Gammaproteobacteria bacterium]|nr:FAD-dependent oxidoreductase [Gammaproteobacteria bacterium]
MTEHLVVVGAGQAASQAAQTLRQQNYAGAITLLGEEPYAPYQRPPLSKKYFSGETPRERLLLRPQAFYAEKGIALDLGARVEELEAAAHRLRLRDGRQLRYDKLLIATGSRPRMLTVPGADLPGVHHVRTIADIDALNASLSPGARVVVIGGGYIGLEMASVARQRGFAVTVLEAADRVLGRVVCEPVSAFYTDLHRAAGVEVEVDAAVRALHGSARVEAVETADGRRFACDAVIVGIGVVPNVELAQAAGLECTNGIRVDEYARTADADVLACGDCTSHPLPLYARSVRLESVPNAVHQAKVAAATLLGNPSAYSEIPWFWSDQYDVKMQIVGLSHGHDTAVLRGDPAQKSFAVYYLANRRLIAVDAVGSPREFAHAKKLIGAAFTIDAEVLRDPRTDPLTLG